MSPPTLAAVYVETNLPTLADPSLDLPHPSPSRRSHTKRMENHRSVHFWMEKRTIVWRGTRVWKRRRGLRQHFFWCSEVGTSHRSSSSVRRWRRHGKSLWASERGREGVPRRMSHRSGKLGNTRIESFTRKNKNTQQNKRTVGSIIDQFKEVTK